MDTLRGKRGGKIACTSSRPGGCPLDQELLKYRLLVPVDIVKWWRQGVVMSLMWICVLTRPGLMLKLMPTSYLG